MTIAAFLYPCLSVFALQAPAVDTAQTTIAPVVASAPAETAAPERTAGPVSDEPVMLAQAETQLDAEGDIAVEAMPQAEEIEPDLLPKPVFADLTDEQVFDKAIAWLEGIDTMQAHFTQIAASGNVSTGIMQLSRPGRLRFEFDDPSPILIVATQGLVYVHDTELETTDSYPVNKTPLKFLLSKEIDKSDAELTYVLRGEDSVALTLESTDVETEGQLVLEFDAPEMKLTRWSVYDPRGVTVVELDDLETGVRIANNAFRVPEAGGSFLRDR